MAALVATLNQFAQSQPLPLLKSAPFAIINCPLRLVVLRHMQLLDSLSPGLGWRLFVRYPEEFGHPDATDYWCMLSAVMLGNEQID